jgi:hypothetical protein
MGSFSYFKTFWSTVHICPAGVTSTTVFLADSCVSFGTYTYIQQFKHCRKLYLKMEAIHTSEPSVTAHIHTIYAPKN